MLNVSPVGLPRLLTAGTLTKPPLTVRAPAIVLVPVRIGVRWLALVSDAAVRLPLTVSVLVAPSPPMTLTTPSPGKARLAETVELVPVAWANAPLVTVSVNGPPSPLWMLNAPVLNTELTVVSADSVAAAVTRMLSAGLEKLKLLVLYSVVALSRRTPTVGS